MSNPEIAPVMGDLVFTAENFRRQEGRPLTGAMTLPGKKPSDIEWMRRMAQKHGYFDGRGMQELLETPAGRSFVKQMANGIPR
jgi:hypothetical protein